MEFFVSFSRLGKSLNLSFCIEKKWQRMTFCPNNKTSYTWVITTVTKKFVESHGIL